MSSSQQKSLIIIIIVSLLGYVVAQFALSSVLTSSSLAIAIGILIGGVIATFSANGDTEKKEASKSLYVGNLPYKANEAVVRDLFEQHGKIFSVRLLKDKHTGKRRGFGFVEVAEKDSDKIISALNDKEFQQRTLKVREAKQKAEDTSVSGENTN
ncbi:RNA recognition motif domain-containing protein [Pseudoalteromonas piratica]|uniref:RNA-binding protein n=1 Tax=Pseudoalteromonas piratica TaxID=1348114 RepID=A0A0A7EEK6_9GAMM|nr:RNA-binding protein [Pseudoalteromonas piratica]AIY64457.1 RNA-binding protein [Pseudoalteromonas piratica]